MSARPLSVDEEKVIKPHEEPVKDGVHVRLHSDRRITDDVMKATRRFIQNEYSNLHNPTVGKECRVKGYVTLNNDVLEDRLQFFHNGTLTCHIKFDQEYDVIEIGPNGLTWVDFTTKEQVQQEAMWLAERLISFLNNP